MHVIRFDYHGTGDSKGGDSDPARLSTWSKNIEDAASLLRQHCRVASITLVGLRFGATLATLAAEKMPDVDTVALLAPVVSGRTHLRELRLLARVWHEQAFGRAPPERNGDTLEVTGTRHSAETIRLIGGVDLRKTTLSGRRVLVMDTGERIETTQLAARLEAQDCDVARLPFLGEADFLREPVTSRIPYDAFAHLTAWIGQRPTLTTIGLSASPDIDATIDIAHGSETPIRFGPDGRLFGILCRPAHAVAGTPIVIMANTGRSHHIGDGRFYVTLARDLAAQGTASLRMDISGLGDSGSDVRTIRTGLHDLSSCDDIIAAIDRVTAMGWSSVSLIGVCSGAFLAFQTALLDPRITGLDLINQQRFLSPTDLTEDVIAVPRRRPASFYAKSLLRGFAWRALLSGRVDVVGIGLGVLRPRIERHLRWLGRHYEAISGRPTRSGAVHRLFRRLAARRVTMRLWYGDTDPGWPELESWFGRKGAGIRRFPTVQLRTLAQSDHALHDLEARARLTRLLCEHLSSPPAAAPAQSTADEPVAATSRPQPVAALTVA